MSLRVDTSSLLASSLVCGNRGLGVMGSDIPSTGDNGAGYAYNDLNLPSDATKEICGRITSWPSAGDLYAYEDTSFEFSGPDGSYTFAYQLYVDGVATGSPATVYLQIGSPDATFALTTDGATFSGSAGSAGAPTTAGFALTTEDSVFSGTIAGYVLPTIARPASDTTPGSWHPSTGLDLYAMIDEVVPDDADYIYANSATTCTLALTPVADPLTSSGQVVSYRAWSATSDGLTVRLMQGATVIAAWTHVALPTLETTYTQSLSPAECDAITNYAGLSIEFESL